ncbi:uncharacterized protein LOC130760084 [Actinidia eriantha]|uniref:uncharacterized protein LOC130760084 n=1 Tax=Actinidia eriantha TaxID=165200 RepID=UPI00258DEBF7|nr:uncharacterized protein LOC130760084 [Actinidia eriantha]
MWFSLQIKLRYRRLNRPLEEDLFFCPSVFFKPQNWDFEDLNRGPQSWGFTVSDLYLCNGRSVPASSCGVELKLEDSPRTSESSKAAHCKCMRCGDSQGCQIGSCRMVGILKKICRECKHQNWKPKYDTENGGSDRGGFVY